MSATPRSLNRLKSDAKILKKAENITNKAALDRVAKDNDYPNWESVVRTFDNIRLSSQPTPPVSNSFVDDLESTDELNAKLVEERAVDLALEIKLKINATKSYLASVGIDFSIFEPTLVGLDKAILDATRPVRTHFELEGFHFFNQQGQGNAEHGVIKAAYFVTSDEIIATTVSLYRPKTKKGDPRMWFSKLPSFAKAADQIAIVIFEDALYLFNSGDISLPNIDDESAVQKLIVRILDSKGGAARELLEKLRIIATHPIKAHSMGDTAVGMAVEHALGIAPNSSKAPDYKKIELKSGRGRKSRATLFAQVPDWSLSACKSSAGIINKYGYTPKSKNESKVDDDVVKLYCTITARKENPQGLVFVIDEAKDWLIERDAHGNDVAVWTGDMLRNRMLEKHAETFWIQAKSTKIDGVEHFDLQSVTHTKKPLLSQVMQLLQSGVITMDHLIKSTGGDKPTVKEKGPLFKINKRDLHLLFPRPISYSLKT